MLVGLNKQDPVNKDNLMKQSVAPTTVRRSLIERKQKKRSSIAMDIA